MTTTTSDAIIAAAMHWHQVGKTTDHNDRRLATIEAEWRLDNACADHANQPTTDTTDGCTCHHAIADGDPVMMRNPDCPTHRRPHTHTP